MATDETKPALLFSSAIEIYNANKAFSNIDTSTITGIPANPVNENLLSPLGADNIYAKNLSDAFSALELDKKSITSSDNYAKYQIGFKTNSQASIKANVSVSELTKVAKKIDFGTGNDNVQEKINYINEYGDKLLVNHQYKTVTSFAKLDHSLKLHSTISDELSQVFSAESGSKAIRSTFSTSFQSTYNFNVKNNTGTTKDNTKQTFHFKSPEIKIDSSIVNSTTSTDDNATFIASTQTKNMTYAKIDKNPENAYKLHYDVTHSTIDDNTITTLKLFTFSDSGIAIEAKGVIDGDSVSKGALKVDTAFFTLKTNSPSAKELLDLNTDGYGDKSQLDGLFSSSNEFKGTDHDDNIVIKAVKPIGATTRDPGEIVQLKVDAGDGDDIIVASKSGGNTITGGDGKDTFVIGNGYSGSIIIKSTTETRDASGIKITYSAEMQGSDTITDFNSQVDRLSLGKVANRANYAEGTESVEDFSAALTAATVLLKAMRTSGERFAFEFDSTNGYLFDDVNGDGIADQVIVLTGIDNEGIAASDITI
jgi:hypothetical protein